MKACLKKVILGCLGSSGVVTAVVFFRNPETWGIGSLFSNFAVTFILATIIVAAFFWVRERISKG